jgi:hypothetical protein
MSVEVPRAAEEVTVQNVEPVGSYPLPGWQVRFSILRITHNVLRELYSMREVLGEAALELDFRLPRSMHDLFSLPYRASD